MGWLWQLISSFRMLRVEDPLERLVVVLQNDKLPPERVLEYVESFMRLIYPNTDKAEIWEPGSSEWKKDVVKPIGIIRASVRPHGSIERLSMSPFPCCGPAGLLLRSLLKFRQNFVLAKEEVWYDASGRRMLSTRTVRSKLSAENTYLSIIAKLGDDRVIKELRGLIEQEKRELNELAKSPRTTIPSSEDEITWHNLFWCKLACTCYLLGSDQELRHFALAFIDGSTLRDEGLTLTNSAVVGSFTVLEVLIGLLVAFKRCREVERALWSLADPSHPAHMCCVKKLLAPRISDKFRWHRHPSIIGLWRQALRYTEPDPDISIVALPKADVRAGFVVKSNNSDWHHQAEPVPTDDPSGYVTKAAWSFSCMAAYQIHQMVPESPLFHPLAADAAERVKLMEDWLDSNHLHLATSKPEFWWLQLKFGVRDSFFRTYFVTVLPLSHLAAYQVKLLVTRSKLEPSRLASLPIEVREHYKLETPHDDYYLED